MSERNGVNRRAFLGGLVGKAVEFAIPDLAPAFDKIAPDTSQKILKLRELQEQEEEISDADMVSALSGVVEHFEVENEFEWEADFSETHSEILLALGKKKLQLSRRSSWFLHDDDWSDEASIHFSPDEYSIEEIRIDFDGSSENTGRSNLGLRPLLRIDFLEEDDFYDGSNERGFYDYDKKVLLEAVYQATVYGEKSTYWEDVVSPMLQVDEMEEFKKNWSNDYIEKNAIPHHLIEGVEEVIQSPLKIVNELDKKATKISRFDFFRHASLKGQELVRNSTRKKVLD